MARVSDLSNNDAAQSRSGQIRDFTHASKSYVSTPGYPNAPKFGFHFHVNFVFNQIGAADPKLISIMVKNADLPKFNVETDVLNKYNKKEIIQKKITYEPVNLVFHDDRGGAIRDLWLAYNQYYYADSNITLQAYEQNDTYSARRLATKYGLDNGQEGRFLRTVEIYSFGDQRYFKYALVNPIVSSFDFANHNYSEGSNTMEATMRLEYENVLYADGSTTNIPGFGLNSPYYDNKFSDLKPGIMLPPQTTQPYQFNEQERVSRPRAIPISNFETTIVPAVKLSNEQQKQIKVNAVNSLQRNRRFSFPTATEIDNLSSLVDINANLRPKQGIVNKSASVTSNGVNVASTAQSSVGTFTVNQQLFTNLIINPKIPEGLTSTEEAAFIESYPPLPSTDPRTRYAPYV